LAWHARCVRIGADRAKIAACTVHGPGHGARGHGMGFLVKEWVKNGEGGRRRRGMGDSTSSWAWSRDCRSSRCRCRCRCQWSDIIGSMYTPADVIHGMYVRMSVYGSSPRARVLAITKKEVFPWAATVLCLHGRGRGASIGRRKTFGWPVPISAGRKLPRPEQLPEKTPAVPQPGKIRKIRQLYIRPLISPTRPRLLAFNM
jgi:hypothetical protein